MLSHHEDRQLRAIEQWFEESDPHLSRMLRDHEAPERNRHAKAARVALDVTGGMMFVLGALAATAVLMVFGVLVLAAGACLHMAARK
jgi:predicted metal-dependent hydrolase